MQLRLLKRIVLFLPFAALTPLFAAQSTNAPATPAAPAAPQARRPVPARTNVTNVPVRGTPVPKVNAATNAIDSNVNSTSAGAATPAVTAAPPSPAAPPAPAPVAPVAAPQQPAAVAAPKAKAEEMVPLINFDNMPLGQVLDFYSEMIGRTVLRASSLPITTFITLKSRGPMTKTEAQMALETVMSMNGITVIPVGDKFVKVVVEGAAPQSGGKFYEGDPKDLPEAGRFVTQIIQLKYILVDDAVKAIQAFGKTGGGIIPIPGSQTLVLRDYSENVKRMVEVLEKVDVLNELQVKPEVIPIKYALAGDIAQVLGSLTASGPGVSVGRSSRSGLSSSGAGTSSGYQSGSQGMSNTGMSQPSTGGLSTGSIGRQSSFGQRLGDIVRRASASGEIEVLGETKIIADERTNSLLIFANAQDMVMIKTIIAQLDVVLAQVLIEALIMDISLRDTLDVGVSYVQQPKSLGNNVRTAGGVNGGSFLNRTAQTLLSGGTNATGAFSPAPGITPGGFSYYANLGSGFDVAVAAAASDQRVNILSRPRIQTSHAVEARLFVGETVPYITGSIYYNSTGGPSSQYQQKEVGISLNVLPLINPDGLVVMDISQNIEQIGAGYDPSKANEIPPGTIKREALAKVAVKDGETIVLGGFISTENRPSKSGVPYLKDIPVLGALFRSRREDTTRSELMVFIRPTVLPTPEIAATVASDERDKLPGIKQGEMEVREYERKRTEQIEKEMRKKMGLKEPNTTR